MLGTAFDAVKLSGLGVCVCLGEAQMLNIWGEAEAQKYQLEVEGREADLGAQSTVGGCASWWTGTAVLTSEMIGSK